MFVPKSEKCTVKKQHGQPAEAVADRGHSNLHMLRHSTGYALAARGMDTRRLQHFLEHAAITNTVRYTAMSGVKEFEAELRKLKERIVALEAA
jgi:site-specific recombinase XerD